MCQLSVFSSYNTNTHSNRSRCFSVATCGQECWHDATNSCFRNVSRTPDKMIGKAGDVRWISCNIYSYAYTI
jgi:hypothetical protein